MSGEVSFFELGVGDPRKARAFYGELFDWRFEPGPSGGEDGGYVISTPNLRGGLHGGDEGASPLLFFAVADIDAAVAKVRELGGEADALPDSDEAQQAFGHFVMCKDDQGSPFGLHQPPAG
jgi:uncharacterized protein